MVKRLKAPRKNSPKPEMLDRFGIVGTGEPLQKALRFTGENGATSAFIVGPEALAEVLTDLNGLLVDWAEFPESVRATVSGPSKALPANRIELQKGRDASELAMTIHAGPMQFVYLLPLEGFVIEAVQLLKQVRPYEKQQH